MRYTTRQATLDLMSGSIFVNRYFNREKGAILDRMAKAGAARCRRASNGKVYSLEA